MTANWSQTHLPCFVPGLWITAQQLLEVRDRIEAVSRHSATEGLSNSKPKWQSSKMRTLVSQFIQHSTTTEESAQIVNKVTTITAQRQERKKTTIQKAQLTFLQKNPNVRISCISPLYESLYFTVGPTPRRTSGAKSVPMWFTYECAADGSSIFDTLKQLHGEQEQKEQKKSEAAISSSLTVASRHVNDVMDAMLMALNPFK